MASLALRLPLRIKSSVALSPLLDEVQSFLHANMHRNYCCQPFLDFNERKRRADRPSLQAGRESLARAGAQAHVRVHVRKCCGGGATRGGFYAIEHTNIV